MMDNHLSKWTVHLGSSLKTLICYFISWESLEKFVYETKLICCSNNSKVALNDDFYYKVVFNVTESNLDSSLTLVSEPLIEISLSGRRFNLKNRHRHRKNKPHKNMDITSMTETQVWINPVALNPDSLAGVARCWTGWQEHKRGQHFRVRKVRPSEAQARKPLKNRIQWVRKPQKSFKIFGYGQLPVMTSSPLIRLQRPTTYN